MTIESSIRSMPEQSLPYPNNSIQCNPISAAAARRWLSWPAFSSLSEYGVCGLITAAYVCSHWLKLLWDSIKSHPFPSIEPSLHSLNLCRRSHSRNCLVTRVKSLWDSPVSTTGMLTKYKKKTFLLFRMASERKSIRRKKRDDDERKRE